VTSRPVDPYKGLAAFEDTELDALLFFGRENDTEVIAANLLASRFTVLYGATGVGKSSVLRAGVVRRVRSLAPEALVVVHDTWAGDAAQSLSDAIAAALRGTDPPERDVPLVDQVAVLVERLGGHLYLVLDQFEEAFSYAGATALADELSEVVTRPKLRVNVLLAVREDALSELDVFAGRIPDVFGNYLPLDRLDRAGGRAAVTGPIARFNDLSKARPMEVEPELVEAVLDEVEVGRIALRGVARGTADTPGSDGIEAPYLQLVMQRLWDAEQADLRFSGWRRSRSSAARRRSSARTSIARWKRSGPASRTSPRACSITSSPPRARRSPTASEISPGTRACLRGNCGRYWPRWAPTASSVRWTDASRSSTTSSPIPYWPGGHGTRPTARSSSSAWRRSDGTGGCSPSSRRRSWRSPR
jgi:hypothetical protein